MTHRTPSRDACSLAIMLGIAMLTIVRSSRVMKNPSDMTIRTAHGLPRYLITMTEPLLAGASRPSRCSPSWAVSAWPRRYRPHCADPRPDRTRRRAVLGSSDRRALSYSLSCHIDPKFAHTFALGSRVQGSGATSDRRPRY